RRLLVRQDLPRDRLEGRLHGRAAGADGRAPQDPSVPHVLDGHAAAVRARRLLARAARSLSVAAGFLPREARPLRTAPRADALRADADARRVLPARGLRADLVGAGYGVRAPSDDRARRRRDPDLGVLRGAAEIDVGALLLREGGADPARGRRAAPRRVVPKRGDAGCGFR